MRKEAFILRLLNLVTSWRYYAEGLYGDGAVNVLPKKSVVYFDPYVLQALERKAASTNVSFSELVNEAVWLSTQASQQSSELCVEEPGFSYKPSSDTKKKPTDIGPII